MLLRNAIVAMIVVAALAIAMLFNEFHAYSSDSGLHYALVRALMDSVDHGLTLSSDTLGAMATYPPIAHWLAAGVGHLTGSGLLGMTVIVSVAVVLFYLLMFLTALHVSWRAAFLAFLITAIYAALRGPVFGRMVVNNYFYAQAVGSSIMVVCLFIVMNRFQKWKGLAIDAFVLAVSQLIVATHLMPAAQLVLTYCFILLVQAWTRASWQIFARLCVFAVLALTFTAVNKYASPMFSINQSGGGAHINLLGNPVAQVVFVVWASYAAIQLILVSRKEENAGLFLGCFGLGTSVFAAVTIIMTWVGFGTHYSIEKCMFVTLAVFIFVISANLALRYRHESELPWFETRKGLAWCAIAALVATRIDLFPSVTDLRAVRVFQAAVNDLSKKSPSADGRRSIAIATIWPPNIPFGITFGDLQMPQQFSDLLLLRKPLPQERVRFAYMPPNDPAMADECVLRDYSNSNALALDYGCFLLARSARPPAN